MRKQGNKLHQCVWNRAATNHYFHSGPKTMSKKCLVTQRHSVYCRRGIKKPMTQTDYQNSWQQWYSSSLKHIIVVLTTKMNFWLDVWKSQSCQPFFICWNLHKQGETAKRYGSVSSKLQSRGELDGMAARWQRAWAGEGRETGMLYVN